MNKSAPEQTPLREAGKCKKPPKGWYCTIPNGHKGPCAAHKLLGHNERLSPEEFAKVLVWFWKPVTRDYLPEGVNPLIKYLENWMADNVHSQHNQSIQSLIDRLPEISNNPYPTDRPVHHLTLGRNTAIEQVRQLLEGELK